MEDIRISHLYKSYGDKPVLRDVSARIPSGRITCLTGPSGCGKTTLLRILMGLEAADSGTVTELPRISAVFQEDRLCPQLDAISNIRLVNPSLCAAVVEQELERLGLEHSSHHQPVQELSGGMCRRIAILRALLAEHEFLLLDEPFRGLDDATKKQVLDYTRTRCSGHTVLMVTHDLSEAAAMDAAQSLTLPLLSE